MKNLCPHCGTDLDIEKEVFANDKLFTGHNCQGYDNSEKQKIIRVLSVLRQNGGFDFEVLGMGMNTSGYPGAFTKIVQGIIRSVIYGKVLHLYSGTSLIGDERIDLEHPNATKNCRVEDFLKEDTRDWDWVLLDPPYAIQRANLKLGAYGEYGSLSGNTLWQAVMRRYCQRHIDNILWLDFCAPSIKGFGRKKLWLLLPGGFHTVRVLSWLKREMKPML